MKAIAALMLMGLVVTVVPTADAYSIVRDDTGLGKGGDPCAQPGVVPAVQCLVKNEASAVFELVHDEQDAVCQFLFGHPWPCP